MGDEINVKGFVLKCVEQNVAPSDPWTTKKTIIQASREWDFSDKEVVKAIHELEDEMRILYWHGKVTLSVEHVLTAVAREEKESDVERSVLRRKLSEHLDKGSIFIDGY